MGQKFSKPPIFYTIGQIQFSTVLGMGKFVNDIQESLRNKYPDFRQDKITNLVIQLGGEGPKEVQPQSTDRWHFSDAKKTSGYILKTDALVFHTTQYETSEVFFKCVLEGIEVINKYARLSFVESVAIRTLDAVIAEHGTKLRQYLNPSVCGLSEGLEGQLKQSVVESVWEIPPGGVLISRSAIKSGALAFPMDLFPLSLELRAFLRELNAEHALLDNDRQEKGRFDFSLDEIRNRLAIVKMGATDAFEKAVTPFALERWK